jgi:hypothetical protein
MNATDSNYRAEAKGRVLEGLARLRAAFPLEQRILGAATDTRHAYTKLLRHWLSSVTPASTYIDDVQLAQLTHIDAIVLEEHGLGCYPFSSRDTGIWVSLPDGTVNAMCAFDALAIARLVRARTYVDSACAICATGIKIQMEENGGLDHDQVEMARVIWQDTEPSKTSCSQSLCSQIRFLCPNCTLPASGELFTLPQAAAIGNAFFRFQTTLLEEQYGRTK